MSTYTRVAPERSLAQRMSALERANLIRSYRAALKRDLKSPRVAVDVAGVLLDPDERLETMRVADFLLAVPGFGKTKRNKALTRCAISPSKTIGGLSPRQRAELVGLVHNGLTPKQRATLEALR